MLDSRGAILDVARRVSDVLRRSQIDGAVIGGVAVTLHGHVRTTVDVDVFAPAPTAALADALRADGMEYDRRHRQFVCEGVPVQLVTEEIITSAPTQLIDIDDIRTVGLADLINMKLRSGSTQMLRAQDLADVIGLIRQRKLHGDFAACRTAEHPVRHAI